jgi:hypothetical protein
VEEEGQEQGVGLGEVEGASGGGWVAEHVARDRLCSSHGSASASRPWKTIVAPKTA